MRLAFRIALAASMIAALPAGAAPIADQPALARVEWPDARPGEIRLLTNPSKVYFTDANAKEGTIGSILFLMLDVPEGLPARIDELTIDYLKGGVAVRSDRLAGDLLEAVHIAPPFPPENGRVRPHYYRLMLTMPARAGVESVRFTAAGKFGSGATPVSLSIPVAQYAQKTRLVFPFKGRGLISSAGALAGGHRNRSGLYAIDVLGLGESYGPVALGVPDDSNASYAGWSREIIAPAAGTVVFARNDHVDQPVPDNSDPKYYDPKWPDGGDPGNIVIIDHGNGELSMIAHLQKGSVAVRAGDKVAQGQRLGLLGNSGDTSGPHLHYQLQNGPDWEKADALPMRFDNVGNLRLGAFFNAR